MRLIFVISSVAILLLVATLSLRWPALWWALIFIVPLILRGVYDMLQTRHSLLRNYPLIGHARWLMEFIRPYVRQY